MTISGVRADPGRSEEQEKDKEGGGRKEGSGFSKSDEGKAISIKGDIVKVNGIRRKVPCPEMFVDMCAGMRVDICVDMRVDMYVETCV